MNGYKKRTRLTASLVPAVLSCALLFSCDNENILDEYNSKTNCNNICFGISYQEEAQTRSNDNNNETHKQFVLRSDDEADTLCVYTTVSNGIHISDFHGEEALTRGMMIQTEDLSKFHVLAYWKKDGTSVEQFYMDENVEKNDVGIWNSEIIHYWPGVNHTLQFHAWAPANTGFTTDPSSPNSTKLEYTVPSDVTEQTDIVVAKTNELAGNLNETVPLTFNHIFTAIKFSLGGTMQPGSIISVALTGVSQTGTYNMQADAWSLEDTTGDFTQEVNMETTGNEESGTSITTEEGTFMMLPQTLPVGAEVEVVFEDAGGKHTLTASVAGMEWQQGTTVNYAISITPQYEIEIEVPSEAQDAHYISFPITINVKDYDGEWTLTSNLTSDVFFTQTKTPLQEQGYWIEEDKGTATITGSGSSTYYVYVTENIGDNNRDIEFQITPNTTNNAKATTAIVQQLSPSWNGDIGCERIEDGSYPWGFKWDRKVKYEFNGFNIFLKYIFENRYETTGTYYTYEMTGNLIKKCIVTIDYSKLSYLDGANDRDGLVNTKYLYQYTGSSGNIDEIEQFCIDYESLIGGKFEKTDESGSSSLPTTYAAFEALMRNKFNKQVIENNGQEEIMPLLKEENMVWYLPSSTECLMITDEEYPFTGDYWTSNAVDDNNEKAYYFTVSSDNQYQVATGDRLDNNKVRAIRKRP